MTSCEDYFDGVNVDPDNPIEVTPNVLLPVIQTRIAFNYWGDLSRHIGIFTQHVDGVGRQFVVYQNYGVQPNDVDNIWSTLYTGVLADNREMFKLAEEIESDNYKVISLAMEAYTLMTLTDLFGDIPYSQALQGLEVLQPQFDAQENIYADILRIIGEAQALAANPTNVGRVPGGDDLIYGGDMGQWAKFLNVLEARAHLHLADRDASSYNSVISALDQGGFTSRDDDARFSFGTGATEAAPWYQYIQQRDDCEVGANYVQVMADLNDPRVDIYGYLQDLGPDTAAHPIYVINRDVPLLSFTEQEFMRAEALAQTSGASAANDFYESGITSSMNDAGITDETAISDYIATVALSGDNTAAFEQIMTQKYIAMFSDPEAFNDWRRTGIPNLTPNTGSEVPRRLPYPQTEIFSNENTPSAGDVNIFSRVWWDD